MTFIETTAFTKQIKHISSDDELKALQCELIASPGKGDLIRKTGGLRKIRMPVGSKGKRSSARIIYFLTTKQIIYLVAAYSKKAKNNLTNAEKLKLKKLIHLLTL